MHASVMRSEQKPEAHVRPDHSILSFPYQLESRVTICKPLQGREESGGGMYNVVKIFVVSRGVWLYPHSAFRLMKLLPGRATCLLRPGEAEISLCSVWRDPRCCGPALGAGLICPRQAWVAEVMMDAQTQRQLSLICVYGIAEVDISSIRHRGFGFVTFKDSSGVEALCPIGSPTLGSILLIR